MQMQPALLSWESGSGGEQEGVHGGWGCSGKWVGQQESIKGAKGMDWKEQWYTLVKVGL